MVDMADKTINIPKENRKMAISVYLRTIFAAVLGFIIFMSISMITMGLFTKDYGTRIYEVNEDGSTKIIFEEHYSNTTTTVTQISSGSNSSTNSSTNTSGSEVGSSQSSGATEASSSGSGNTSIASTATTTGTTLASNQRKETLRTTLPNGISVASDILSQLFMAIILISMPYSILWMQGDRDANKVQFGHMDKDLYRGLKVGAMAAIPSLLAYIVLLISRLFDVLPSYPFIFRFLNASFLPIVNRTFVNVKTSADIPAISFLILFLFILVVPAVCTLAYYLGYRHISISEKIIYVDPKKKKKRRHY